MQLRSVIRKYPLVMIVIGIIGISLSSIFVKFSSAPSGVTATFRLGWTVLLMTPAVFTNGKVRKELFSIRPSNVLLSCISGFFLAIHFILWFESLNHTSVASSTTIVCTEVIWVSLGYCLFLKGKLGLKAIWCMAVTLIGSVLIALSDHSAGTVQVYGDLLALAAAVAVAVYVLIGRVVRVSVSTTVYTYIVYVSCASVLLLITMFQGISLLECDTSVVIVGLLLALFSTILGHSIFSWCLKYFSPSFVSASKLCEPVVAAAIAYVLFGETLSFMQLIGGILIIGGVYSFSKIELN